MGSIRSWAGWAAIAGAVGGVVYAIAFLVVGDVVFYSTVLMIGGLLTSLVVVVLADEVQARAPALAAWGRVLGVIGSLGSVAHGGYDLANALNPPDPVTGLDTYPSAIDPRGLLTFGLVGLAFLVLGGLMARAGFPGGLARLGQLLGALLVVIYLGRLIILDPDNAVVRAALFAGVAVNTVFLSWLGSVWIRGPASPG